MISLVILRFDLYKYLERYLLTGRIGRIVVRVTVVVIVAGVDSIQEQTLLIR
jgi:hypothetical protein